MRKKVLKLFFILLFIITAVIILLRFMPGKSPHLGKVKIAVFQFSSNHGLDETRTGLMDGLKQSGYTEKNTIIKKYNAESDISLANELSKKIIGENFDIIFTIGTPALKIMASHNDYGKTNQVFGAVSDPYGAGGDISRKDHYKHPSWLTGIGTFPPIKETITIVKQINPDLKKAGTIVDPKYLSSIACLKATRKTCEELDIDLQIVQVDNSNELKTATETLISKGVEAIFIGVDYTVASSPQIITDTAAKAGIPVFGYTPILAMKGALLAMGANYYKVGEIQAMIGVKILQGASPSTIPVENVTPVKICVNMAVLNKLKNKWVVPSNIINKTSIIIDDTGIQNLAKNNKQNQYLPVLSSKISPKRPAPKKMILINYNESPTIEENQNGFLSELERFGVKLGKDYEINIINTEGDIKTVFSLLEDLKKQKYDLILTTTTPVLQACMKIIPNQPVIFSVVADPLAIGAGTTMENHLPNMTGVSSMSNFKAMTELIIKFFPNAKRIGSLYNPNETNSIIYREKFQKELHQHGLKLITQPNTTRDKVADATEKLINKNIDILCQISDNLHNNSFTLISQTTRISKVPLISFVATNAIKNGAILSLAQDFEEGGRSQALMAIKVLRGKKISKIPFTTIERTRIVVNPKNARMYNFVIPEGLLKKADMIIE